MIEYERNNSSVEVLHTKTKICDNCKVKISKIDVNEWSEFRHFSFETGRDSVFGDHVSVDFDLCQSCLQDMIMGFCRIDDKSVE